MSDKTTSKNTINIMVAGVGGGGCNALQTMLAESDLQEKVKLVALNTDQQALDITASNMGSILLGPECTKGHGAGGDPSLAAKAAEESTQEIEKALEGIDLLFVTAGAGGGTGSGAGPRLPEIAKSKGILVISVVTTPFSFEGERRARIAGECVDRFLSCTDSVIVIDNNNLMDVTTEDTSIKDAFLAVDSVLVKAVRSICDLILKPGFINTDYNDVKNALSNRGYALIGMAESSGENRAQQAMLAAINSPLLAGVNIDIAESILVNISASEVKISEYKKIGDMAIKNSGPDTEVTLGISEVDDLPEDVLRVTIIVAGVSREVAEGRKTAVKAKI